MKTHLWEKTRDLHHACEEHAVGAAMASGNPPDQWYADWLQSLLDIHTIIDVFSIEEVRRTEQLTEDLKQTISPRPVTVAKEYALGLKEETEIAGAKYVLLGAHLMGGEIMRRRLVDYPTKHLEWTDRKKAIQELEEIKKREDIVEESRNCFYALLRVMDEIKGLDE